MRFIKPDVATTVCGIAMSMGSLLLAGGAKGKRGALPEQPLPGHQPPGGVPGPDNDIQLHINSPGGVVYSGLTIYDTMRFIKPDVATTVCGIAMSMGSLLLAGGAKGKRSALPNSRILVHQPHGGFQGQATDIQIHAKETLALRRRMEQIYAEHTGRSVDEIS